MSHRSAAANAEQIGGGFFPPDRVFDADVALALGMNDPSRPAEKAAELYHAGRVGRILFTGGPNASLGSSEAEAMALHARRLGVPECAMMIEAQARHTEDNLALARAMLGPAQRLLLVTLHVHLRRAMIAAHRHFPAPARIGWVTYPSRYYDARNWFESERGRADVKAENAKIMRYYGASCGIVPVENSL